MLKGFRWQLVVLLMALVLFGLSVISRVSESPSNVIEPTAQPTLNASPAPAETPLPSPIPPDNALLISETPTYREGLVGQVQRLNPLFANLNPVDRDIASLIFEGLTRINAYGEAVPGLAQSWVISSDGLEYIIRLREDVLWQDGIPFGAVDVVYTLNLLQSPDFPGDPALGKFWQTIEVQQLDDHLIRFRLTQPLGEFLDTLQIGILPEHALRGTTARQIASHPFNLSPIGTGPYQLEALRSAVQGVIQSVDLRVAPVYRQRPEGQGGYAMERMSFRLYPAFEQALGALQSGEIDGLAGQNQAERAAVLGLSTISIHTTIEPSLGVLIFNWENESTRFFREQRVRLALQTALDRTSLVERYLSGTAVRADSPLIPGSWAYTGDLAWPPLDLNGAAQLLETANLRQSDDQATQAAGQGVRFSFSILTANDPTLVSLAQDIATQWSQLNIQVRVEAVDPNTYQARLNAHEFEAALVEFSLGGSAAPDVYSFWDGDKNYGSVDDRHIAEELERARRDPSGINRAIRYGNFQREFVERAIAIPLYYPLYSYATQPQIAGVQLGFLASPANRFSTLKDWVIAPPA